MKIYKKVAITFDNSEILDVEGIDVLKFINDAFKIIESEGEIVSRIIISEEVWRVFREGCGMDFLSETPEGNYIWTAEIEIISDCPMIIFLSGDYILPAEELIKQGELK